MADLTGKQYNIVVNLVGFSSDLGSRFASIEEMVEEYTLSSPPFDTLNFNQDAIKHLDSNDVAVWMTAWNTLIATPAYAAFRAAMRQAAP